MSRRLTARRRTTEQERQARRRLNRDTYESRKPQPTWWSRLTDHERADWLRDKARTV